MDKLTTSLFQAGEKSPSPYTCPVDIHDAIPVLPIDLSLAKAYRYIHVHVCVVINRVCASQFCVVGGIRNMY